jgi:hypothetical protein
MWVEHAVAPLVEDLPVRLILRFRQQGTLTADAIVVSDDRTAIRLDLRHSPHAFARTEDGQSVALLRRREGLFELADTRVVARSREGHGVTVAAPDGWQRLERDPRVELRVPLSGVVQSEGFPRRFAGETRDLSRGGVRFVSTTALRAGEAAALQIALPDGPTAVVTARVADVEEPRLGGETMYAVRCTYVHPDAGFLQRLERVVLSAR